MLKFRSVEQCEAYISDVGCLVIKQECLEFGEKVTVILSPDQALKIAHMVADAGDEMLDKWNGGLIEERGDDQSLN
jgi:phosphoribosylamine-glycine ligase